jgi:hypothetical protein
MLESRDLPERIDREVAGTLVLHRAHVDFHPLEGQAMEAEQALDTIAVRGMPERMQPERCIQVLRHTPNSGRHGGSRRCGTGYGLRDRPGCAGTGSQHLVDLHPLA